MGASVAARGVAPVVAAAQAALQLVVEQSARAASFLRRTGRRTGECGPSLRRPAKRTGSRP